MKAIEVAAIVNAKKEKTWKYWTETNHIKNWNFASDEWHCPNAESDLREGGRFTSRMEAKDGNMGFDFGGQFTKVIPNNLLEYTLDDGREVSVIFVDKEGQTEIVETFQPENQNSLELQRQGWQAILDNFKDYVESN